jgi:hypothetical protein
MTDRFIYFIKPVGKRGPVKIGSSYYPEERLKQIQRDWFDQLELIGFVPGCVPDEIKLHYRLVRHRQRLHSHREWFRACDELDAVVRRIIELGFIPTNLKAPIHEWGQS